MLVMVGLVAVVLVIAGAGSLILTRNAARNQAQQQLVSEAEVADIVQERPRSVSTSWPPSARRSSSRTPTSSRSPPSATSSRPLPDGLTEQDIDVAGLQSGQTSSGRKGSLVYAAAPVTLTAGGA